MLDRLTATLLLTFILSSTLRPAFKYAGGIWSFLAYSLIVMTILAVYFRSKKAATLRSFLSSNIFLMASFGALALLAVVFYPLADGLKSSMQGQDQDDCLVQGGLAILGGGNPYLEQTYFGNPCSPLPGSLLAYLPFVAMGVFALSGPVFIGLSAFSVHNLLGSGGVGFFNSAVLAIPLTIELVVNGSDFIFMGFGLVGIASILSKTSAWTNTSTMVAVSVLVGLVSSTRVNMPILLGLFLVFLFVQRLQFGVVYAVLAGLVTIAPGAWLYWQSPSEFSPFHLLRKGSNLLPGAWFWVMIGLSVAGLITAYIHLRRSKSDFVLPILFAVSPAIIMLSIADLVARNWNFALWEGASYQMVILPLCVVALYRTMLKVLPLTAERVQVG